MYVTFFVLFFYYFANTLRLTSQNLFFNYFKHWNVVHVAIISPALLALYASAKLDMFM